MNKHSKWQTISKKKRQIEKKEKKIVCSEMKVKHDGMEVESAFGARDAKLVKRFNLWQFAARNSSASKKSWSVHYGVFIKMLLNESNVFRFCGMLQGARARPLEFFKHHRIFNIVYAEGWLKYKSENTWPKRTKINL